MAKQLNYEYDVEFASEKMCIIPAGYIDKTICGCGMTTVALENNVSTIIAVPTIYLAENKSKQYPNERYAGKVLAVHGDITEREVSFYAMNTKVLKIMVTYDSLHKVENLLPRCKLVIDESNELLSKTKLKPEVIDNVFRIAEEYRDTVSFISATPIPLEYMPDWVSEIDQVKIEWIRTTKATPILCERAFPYKSLRDEFILPLKQDGSVTIQFKPNGSENFPEISFDKLIIFINSVNQIIKIVEEAGLDKSECGIICGDSLENAIKIKGIKRYVTGEMPKFTFITASGFCGIDLVDNRAMTVIVSNTKQEWQMMDMLTDLKQAVSRQRDKSNPNYRRYIYIYNQCLFSKSQEELLEKIDGIHDKITDGIWIYENSVKVGKERGFMKDDEFKNYTLEKNDTYVLNELRFKADKYFILETRNQYSKGFDISGAFDGSYEVTPMVLPNNFTYPDGVEYFKANHVEGKVEWYEYSINREWVALIEECYKLYGQVWKDFTFAKAKVKSYGKDDFGLIRLKAKKMFSTGKKYSRADAKIILQKIYDEYGIVKKANCNDVYQIFKKVRQTTVNGVRMIEVEAK
jgi:hypothetical protein